MAAVNKLSIVFTNDEGTNSTFSYKYVKSNITNANVKALITAIIANNIIFARKPMTAKTAKLVQTQETAIDIS